MQDIVHQHYSKSSAEYNRRVRRSLKIGCWYKNHTKNVSQHEYEAERIKWIWLEGGGGKVMGTVAHYSLPLYLPPLPGLVLWTQLIIVQTSVWHYSAALNSNPHIDRGDFTQRYLVSSLILIFLHKRFHLMQSFENSQNLSSVVLMAFYPMLS